MDTYGLVRNSPAGFPALAACIRPGGRALVPAAACARSLARATFSPANALEGVTVGQASASSTPHFLGAAMQRFFFKKIPCGRIGVTATGGNIESSRLIGAMRPIQASSASPVRPREMPDADATWSRVSSPIRKSVQFSDTVASHVRPRSDGRSDRFRAGGNQR